MKKLTFAIALCAALSSPVLHAASKDTAAAPSASKAPSPDTAAFDKNLSQFEEQMKTMHAQMDQIRQTQDPQERQKLLQQHWATMQSAMTTMHGMWGPGGMGHGSMGPGMMGGYYSRLTPEQLRQRQYMTDQYVQMQQEMMNHMMWQQYWMGPPVQPTK